MSDIDGATPVFRGYPPARPRPRHGCPADAAEACMLDTDCPVYRVCSAMPDDDHKPTRGKR